MTPAILNKEIKSGTFYYLPWGSGYSAIVRRARSRRKGDKKWCEVETERGWYKVEGVRRFGMNEVTPLTHEGRLTKAVN